MCVQEGEGVSVQEVCVQEGEGVACVQGEQFPLPGV